MWLSVPVPVFSKDTYTLLRTFGLNHISATGPETCKVFTFPSYFCRISEFILTRNILIHTQNFVKTRSSDVIMSRALSVSNGCALLSTVSASVTFGCAVNASIMLYNNVCVVKCGQVNTELITLNLVLRKLMVFLLLHFCCLL